MPETRTKLTKLLTVQKIEEDASGAVLHFQGGDHARLPQQHPDYATYLRLARRSQERQHPVGVRLAEAQAVAELLRADNDVPAQLVDEGLNRSKVFFQGHDGVFHLQPDHPASSWMRALLDEASRRKARVWFIAQQPDLALLDVMPADGVAAADGGGSGARNDGVQPAPKNGVSSSN